MESKKKTSVGRKKRNEKNDTIDNFSLSNVSEAIWALIHFRSLSTNKKVVVFITIIIVTFYPIWSVTEDWREQHFFKERIHDYFICLPNQQLPCINVAIFQLKNDKVLGNELSIQDLFIDKFKYSYINFTKYSLPIDSKDSTKRKMLLKELKKKYDIIVWGNTIFRDSSKRYKLIYSIENKDIELSDFSLTNGEFPKDCYQKLNSIIPQVLVSKIDKFQLFDYDKYNEELLKGYYSLLVCVIQNEEMLKSVSNETKTILLKKAATISYIISTLENVNFRLDQSINGLEIALRDNIDFESEILLGKAQYTLGVDDFFNDEFDSGINNLSNSVKLFNKTLSNQLNGEKKWMESASWMSKFLPQNREMKIDSMGKQYLSIHLQRNKDIRAVALVSVMTYESFCIRRGISQGNLGLSLYELGVRKNDSTLLNNAKEMMLKSVEELFRKHYMPENDFNYFNLPLGFEDILLKLVVLSSDSLMMNSYIKLHTRVLHQLTKKEKPYTWAKQHYEIACALFHLGLLNCDLSAMQKAINECSLALNVYTDKTRKMEWYKCQKMIAESYLSAYLLSNKSSDNEISITNTINHYRVLLNYCSKYDYMSEYADNMLSLALAIFIDFHKTGNIDKTKFNIDIYKKQKQPEDNLYTVDSYATLELANGVISLLQSNKDGNLSHLYDAQLIFDKVNKNFFHSSAFSKKAISYSLSCIVLKQIWNNTKNENLRYESKKYARMSKTEFQKSISLIVNPLIIQEITRIIDKQ
ncbi:hypothetical protein ACOMSG_02990 [Macellibacteroides fermentans]|uniref:hypothetical protein n=1 Tax=Macellibacteroides fermentans TaxID=879969 RepID=UPI003B9335A1